MKYILFFLLFLTGCANTITTPPVVQEKLVYTPILLDKPEKPELPIVSGKEMKCLSEETKQILLTRDKLQKGYISDLETIIDANNSKVK